MNSNYQNLLGLIHDGRNLYAEFPAGQWRMPPPNWGGEHEWIQGTVEMVRPDLIIEVGSYLGMSAIRMADKLVELGIDGAVLCVDTWLGGLDHRISPDFSLAEMRCHFGRPGIYYGFLANVIAAGHTERVVPFPLDTLNAARFLAAKEIRAGMIYVDASHEAGDVRRDLDGYWPLLASGGAMLIDDLHIRTVAADVDTFCLDNGLKMESLNYKGRIMK